MRNLLYAIMLLILVSCETSKQSSQVYGGMAMRIAYDTLITEQGYKHLCQVEGINPNITKWEVQPYRDFETGKRNNKWMYIAKTGSQEVIYFLQVDKNREYNMIKRITYKK